MKLVFKYFKNLTPIVTSPCPNCCKNVYISYQRKGMDGETYKFQKVCNSLGKKHIVQIDMKGVLAKVPSRFHSQSQSHLKCTAMVAK